MAAVARHPPTPLILHGGFREADRKLSHAIRTAGEIPITPVFCNFLCPCQGPLYAIEFIGHGITKLTMKINSSLAVLTALAALAAGSASVRAAEEEGVALAIVYDTSGSMQEPVRDKNGQFAPKYVIANHALVAIVQQIQSFSTNSASRAPRKIETGLFVFNSPGAGEAVKFGPFDAAALEHWARHFASPSGNTPLGNALNTAAQAVLKSSLSRKHVLVITDGMSNVGPPPAYVLPQLKQQAEQQHHTVSAHFVAFDVDAKVFDPVKKLGATVVGAADEKQLNSQLEFILQKKILLEDEEPAKK